MKWIRDEEFVRGNIPMSKFDIRVIAMALLDINEGDIFVDVGAGTGSLSVQAALMGSEVYAIEKEQKGIELVRILTEKKYSEIEVRLIQSSTIEVKGLMKGKKQ